MQILNCIQASRFLLPVPLSAVPQCLRSKAAVEMAKVSAWLKCGEGKVDGKKQNTKSLRHGEALRDPNRSNNIFRSRSRNIHRFSARENLGNFVCWIFILNILTFLLRFSFFLDWELSFDKCKNPLTGRGIDRDGTRKKHQWKFSASLSPCTTLSKITRENTT